MELEEEKLYLTGKTNPNWSKRESEIFLDITGFDLKISVFFVSPYGDTVNKKNVIIFVNSRALSMTKISMKERE